MDNKIIFQEGDKVQYGSITGTLIFINVEDESLVIQDDIICDDSLIVVKHPIDLHRINKVN